MKCVPLFVCKHTHRSHLFFDRKRMMPSTKKDNLPAGYQGQDNTHHAHIHAYQQVIPFCLILALVRA
jgi:hypothetical protein